MISFGRGWDDTSPVDYAAALAACTDGELSFRAEQAITPAAIQEWPRRSLLVHQQAAVIDVDREVVQRSVLGLTDDLQDVGDH